MNCSNHGRDACLECCNFFKTILGAFNSPMDSTELLTLVCREISTRLPAVSACQILIFNREFFRLEHMASSHLSEACLKNSEYLLEDRMIEQLKQTETDTFGLMDHFKKNNKKVYEKEGVEMLSIIPLTRGIQIVGIMLLFGSEKTVLGDCEIKQLESVGEFVTALMVNFIFNQTLDTVTRTVHASLDIEKVLKDVVLAVKNSLRVKGCTIRLLDKEQNRFELKASSGLSPAYLNKGPVLAKKSISEVLEGKCVAIYDVANDDRLQYPEEAIKEGIGSILSVPLIIYKNIIGDLRVYTHRPYEFSNNEINLMMAVGEQCALAIRDAQMYTGIKEKYDDLISDFHQWFDK